MLEFRFIKTVLLSLLFYLYFLYLKVSGVLLNNFLQLDVLHVHVLSPQNRFILFLLTRVSLESLVRKDWLELLV